MLMLLYILVYTHTAHYNKSSHGNATSGVLSIGEYDWKRTMPIPRATYSPSLVVFCDIVIPHYNSPVPGDCASIPFIFQCPSQRSMFIKSKCGNGTVRTTMIVVNGENENLLLNTLYTYNCTVWMLMLLYILVYKYTVHYNKTGHGNATSGVLSIGEYDWKRIMPIPRAAYLPSLVVFCDSVIPYYISPGLSDCASITIPFSNIHHKDPW